MKRIYIPLFIFTCGVTFSPGADSDALQYRRPVLTEIIEEGLGTVEFDREIFSKTGNNFPDIRLLQESGEKRVERPFVIERVPDIRPGRSSNRIPSEVLSFDQLGNGDVKIRVRLKKEKGRAALLEVKTPLQNFEKSLSVSGIDGKGDEIPLVTGKLIFDYESFLDFRRTTIALPENDYLEFVVQISRATDKQRSTVQQLTRTIAPDSKVTIQETDSVKTRQFRIDELSFYTSKIPREKDLSIRSESFEIIEADEDVETKQTHILFQGDHVPFDSLILETDDRNFKRRVELQIPVKPGEDKWRTVHTGTIHRFILGDFEDENLTVSFSEQRSGQFRLVIHNRDNPPITIQKLVGIGEIYELRFIAERQAKYSIVYGGGDQIDRPDYDVAAIRAALAGNIRRMPLELAATEDNPGYKPIEVRGPGLNQPWILWSAIALVVAGLVGVLLKTAKEIDQKTN